MMEVMKMSENEEYEDEEEQSEDEEEELSNIWPKYQELFDKMIKIGNPSRIVGFLREIVDIMSVCESTECKIFPEIHKLACRRHEFEPASMAEINSLDAIAQSQWKQKYKRFIIDCEQIFSQIYALRITSQSAREKILDRRTALKDYLKICAKYALTPTMAVTGGIEKMINQDAGNALGFTTKEINQADEVAKHMIKVRAHHQKKTQQKEEVI